MRILEGIAKRLPASRADLEAAGKKIQDLETARAEDRKEIGRLEGLLDVVGDPDSGLSGDQRQGLYREISGSQAGSGDRDFSDEHRRRIIQLANLSYALKGGAENLLDTHVDFIAGDAIRPQSKKLDEQSDEANKRFQKVIDEFWADPRNRLPEEVEDYTKGLVLDGELHLEIEPSAIDGHLEIGWIDPLDAPDVLQDARKRDSFLIVNGPNPGEERRYFIVSNLSDSIEITGWPEGTRNPQGYKWLIREESIDARGNSMVVKQAGAHGFVHSGFHNRPKGAKRGRSELTSVLDTIDAQDELIWSAVDVQNIKRLFLLHLKDPSIRTKAQARQALEKYGLKVPPRYPKVLATNDKVELNFPSPEGNKVSEEWLAKELGIQIHGAKGFPVNWRGDTGEGSLASAKAGEFLPLRRLRRKQNRVLQYWKRLVEISLWFRKWAGRAVPPGEVEIVTLEVGGKDIQRGTEILKSAAASSVQMSQINAVKPELLNWLYITLIRQELGLDVAKDIEGLPPEVQDAAAEIEGAVQNLLTQNARTDEGPQDEEDRDREDEEGAA